MVKVQVDLSQNGVAEMARLREMSGLKTDAEVIHNAITFLAWVASEVSQGKSLASLDVSGQTYTTVNSPILDKIRGLS